MKNIKIPVLTYSRIVGYYQPIQAWNKGKRQEFKDRHAYTKEEILNAIGKHNES